MSFVAVSIAGLGVSAASLVGKSVARGKANRALDSLQEQDPAYVENPIAKQRLGLANTLLNARMPGAVQAERNIYTNQANQLGNVNRVATDSAQALGMAAGIGGQTNDSFNKLAMAEDQDYQRRYGNQVAAQEGLINEQDKVFQDKTRRWGDMAQIQGAKSENRTNMWGDISNFGLGMADMGINAYGGGNGGNSQTRWKRRGSNWWDSGN
jgi:hypothetical protein